MKTTVLIVEDNPMNMELATDLLEIAGFSVIQARNAEDGIRLALEAQPRIVLMDLSLPGMDGLTAMQRMKSLPQTQNLPIVALTAHAMKGDEEAALEAGFDGYLQKPIDTRTLASRVASYAGVGLCQATPQ